MKRRLRLGPGEATRVLAAALLALLCLVPSAVRWIAPEPSPSPMPSCPDGARWVRDRVVCAAGPSDLSAAARLLLGQRIDLNTADAASLAVVPGIGEQTARRIVNDREAGGRYRSLEEVERVKGIGPRLRARMEPYVEVRVAAPPD